MNRSNPQSHPDLPNLFESSNTTAHIFLGGRRRSWMLGTAQIDPSQIHSTHLARVNFHAGAGPPLLETSSQNAVLQSQAAVATATAPGALMSPVTPGAILQQQQQQQHQAASISDPSTAPCPITSTSYVINTQNQCPPAALPSPDPSSGCRTRPASVVDGIGEDPLSRAPSSPLSRPLQIQTQPSEAREFAPTTLRVEQGVASIQSGAPSAPDNETVSGQQRNGTGLPRSQLAPVPSASQTSDGAGMVSIRSSVKNMQPSFWASAKKKLDALIAQSRGTTLLSETVELPRIRVLQDACSSKDFLYLVLHQVFCMHTFAPSQFHGLPGFGTVQARGLDVIKQLLVDNQRLSGDFLRWCVLFPCSLQSLEKEYPAQHRVAINQISLSLALISQRWANFEQEVRARSYPPLIDELVVLFGVTSPVLLSIVWTALCRRVFGSRYESLADPLRALYSQNRQNWERRSTGDVEVPPERMQKENENLVHAYLALARQQARDPRLPSPKATAQQHAAQPTPYSQQQGYPPPVPNNGARGQPAAARHNVPGYLNIHPHAHRPDSSQTPSLPSPHLPSNLQGSVPSPVSQQPTPVLPLQSYPPHPQVPQPHIPPQQGSFHHLPQRPPVSQSISPIMSGSNAAMMPNSAPAVPRGRESSRGRPSTRGPPSNRANHAATTTSPVTSHLPNASSQNTLVAPRMSQASPPQGGNVHGPQSRQQQLVHTPVLPGPGFVSQNASHRHSLRVGLHQAHLRSPVRKLVCLGPAGEEETELFHYVNGFAVLPTYLGAEEHAFQWSFMLPGQTIQRFPPYQHRPQERPIRVFREGCQTYRLRCIKVHPSTSQIDQHSWSISESIWPSALYIIVNGTELFVRRKVHNGKDLPLDITHCLREGTNEISVHLLRSAAEQKDVFYALGVEILDVASLGYVKQLVRTLPAPESREEIATRLSSSTDNDELAIVNDHLTIDLVDPFMARVFNTPVRGRTCTHRECFDLDTFLMTRASKSGKGAMKEDWRCPICRGDARPQCLIIDGFLVEVHSELQRTNRLEGARAINIKADGSWELKVQNEAQSAEGGNHSAVPSKRKRSETNASPETLDCKLEGAAVPGTRDHTQSNVVIELD